MPCSFMKILILIKQFKVQCVCVFMENKSGLSSHLLITESTAQAKIEVKMPHLWLRIFRVMTSNHNKTPELRSTHARVNLDSPLTGSGALCTLYKVVSSSVK